MVTFSEDEWGALTPHDKHAIKVVGRVAPNFEPLQKVPRRRADEDCEPS